MEYYHYYTSYYLQHLVYLPCYIESMYKQLEGYNTDDERKLESTAF